MGRVQIWIVGILALCAGGLYAETNDEALKAADAVLAKAPSLDAFVGDAALLTEYYDALRKIYGDFTRKSFDAIITQLQQVKEQVPGFKEKAWAPRTGGNYIGPFTLQPGTEITGREFRRDAYEDWMRRKVFAPLAEDIETLGPEAERAARAAATIAAAKQKIADFQRSLELLEGGRKVKDAAFGKFYKELREDPQLKAATAYLIDARLRSAELKKRLDTGDADIVAHSFEELRTNHGDIPPEIYRLMADRLPKKDAFINNREIFPEEWRVGKAGARSLVGTVAKDAIDILPMHPMHAFFKGVQLECCGGKETFLTSLSPERWANSAFPETQVFGVVQNGRYHGFMMLIPMVGPDGKKYYALDRGAGIIRNKALVPKADGEFRRTSLFEMFVDEVMKRKPAGVRGLVMSDSTVGDNYDTHVAAAASPYYKLGTNLGGKEGFKHVDPAFMQALIAASPVKEQVGHYYGGNGTFDVVNKDVTKVILLTPDTLADARERLANKTKWEKIAQAQRVLDRVARGFALDTESARDLAFLMTDADEETREIARLAAYQVSKQVNARHVEGDPTLVDRALAEQPVRLEAYRNHSIPSVRRLAGAVGKAIDNNFKVGCGKHFMGFLRDNKALTLAALAAAVGLGIETATGWNHWPFKHVMTPEDLKPQAALDLKRKLEIASDAGLTLSGNLTYAERPGSKHRDEVKKLNEQMLAVQKRNTEYRRRYQANGGWTYQEREEVKKLLSEADRLAGQARSLRSKLDKEKR